MLSSLEKMTEHFFLQCLPTREYFCSGLRPREAERTTDVRRSWRLACCKCHRFSVAGSWRAAVHHGGTNEDLPLQGRAERVAIPRQA
mmetsp:Transcript_5678/g.21509  ORF Transcript_5678/g.21509 Transcript_5678/m.21509 type:complete len:87 (+) Transcript_5678:2523-2783(+)